MIIRPTSAAMTLPAVAREGGDEVAAEAAQQLSQRLQRQVQGAAGLQPHGMSSGPPLLYSWSRRSGVAKEGGGVGT